MGIRLFLSYSRHDSARVRSLEQDIESLGHVAWIDRELTGGQRWWDRILEEIRACDAFVYAVSAAAVDSRACLSEYEYAAALGKPVIAVQVDRLAYTFLPPELGATQTVDYTEDDKVAFAALVNALNALPSAPALPGELPAPPPIPASYLYDLKSQIEAAGALQPDVQEALLDQLQLRRTEGYPLADLLVLVQRFRTRDDLLIRVDHALATLEAELEAGAGSVTPTTHVEGGVASVRTVPRWRQPRWWLVAAGAVALVVVALLATSSVRGSRADADDIRVREQILAALAGDPATSAFVIDVTVDHDSVTFSGVVSRDIDDVLVLSVASAFAGGRELHDEIKTVAKVRDAHQDLTLQDAVEAALSGDRTTSDLVIGVEVYNGEVTLSGKVPTALDAAYAVSVAEGVTSVLAVHNALEVDPN